MRFMAAVLTVFLAACQPNLEAEIAELRIRIEQQQVELERLSTFVDTQAAVLTVCQETLSSFMEYVVNLGTFGMLREASAQLENVGQCTEALARFTEAARARTQQRLPGN